MTTMRKLIESMDSIGNITESLNIQETRAVYEKIRNDAMSADDFIDWVYDIRAAAKREVE